MYWETVGDISNSLLLSPMRNVRSGLHCGKNLITVPAEFFIPEMACIFHEESRQRGRELSFHWKNPIDTFNLVKCVGSRWMILVYCWDFYIYRFLSIKAKLHFHRWKKMLLVKMKMQYNGILTSFSIIRVGFTNWWIFKTVGFFLF